MLTRARRVAAEVAGWVLVAAGIVLFPLPGPGLLLLVAGLALLAEHNAWAARRLEPLKLRALREAARGVRTWGHTISSAAVTTALGASGLLWLWAPPQPTWWALPAWTWLPGGAWSGVGQIASGLVALVLVGYAHRRFHGRPEELRELDDRIALSASGML